MEKAGISSVGALRTQITKLRAALGAQGANIHVVRGYGYCWLDHRPAPPAQVCPEPELNVLTGRLVFEGGEIRLARSHVEILSFLVRCAGGVVSCSELRDVAGVTGTAVKTHISMLRSELDPVAVGGITNVRGIGYRYVGPGLHIRARPGVQPAIRVSPRGDLRIDWKRLLVDGVQRSVLEQMSARFETPVSFGEFRDHSNVVSLGALRAAIASLRATLRTEDLRIMDFPYLSRSYMLTRIDGLGRSRAVPARQKTPVETHAARNATGELPRLAKG